MNINVNEFNKYEKLVYKVFNNTFKGYVVHKEDLIQVGFIALLEVLEKGDYNNTYLYIRIKGAMLNYLKKEKKYTYDSLNVTNDYNEEIINTLVDNSYDTSAYNILDMLPSNLREVGELLSLGYTHQMIANELNISDRTVRRYVVKIREFINNINGSDINER